jgi:Tfp pilus assembly protein FimT
MTSKRTQQISSQAGYSIVELLANVAIVGILAGTALPHLDTRRQDLQTVTTQLVSDYRWARAHAITSGAHFNVKWTATNAYQIERMKQTVSGTWTTDVLVKSVTLPATVARSGSVPTLEFNTRGMMVTSTASVDLNLADSTLGGARKITVWPSGQTYVSG